MDIQGSVLFTAPCGNQLVSNFSSSTNTPGEPTLACLGPGAEEACEVLPNNPILNFS